MVAEDLEELDKHYNLEFARKETLENKANNMTAVAGIVAALLFGFGQLLIENLASVKYDWLTHVIVILFIGVIASLASIILSTLGFRVQNYSYVIGHTAVEKPSLLETLRSVEILGLKSGQPDFETKKDAYIKCIYKNSELNDSKAKTIQASLWTFVISIIMVAIILLWLIVAPISFPSA